MLCFPAPLLLLLLSFPLALCHQSTTAVTAVVDARGVWRVEHVDPLTVLGAGDSPALIAAPAPATGLLDVEQGWRMLTVLANDSYTFQEQLFAAGMVEGFLTAELIEDHKANVLAALFSRNVSDAPASVNDFLLAQHEWARAEAEKRLVGGDSSEDKAYWEMVAGMVLQVDGVVEGMMRALFPDAVYGPTAPKLVLGKSFLQQLSTQEEQAASPLSEEQVKLRDARRKFLGDVLYVAGAGDVPMIMSHLNITSTVDWDKLTPEERQQEVIKNSRCSAVIRVTDDFSDLYAGHSTWWNYGTMLRVYKQTNLPFPPSYRRPLNAPKSRSPIRSPPADSYHFESFSSYPGVLSSQDDFYITSRPTIVLQTTNSVYNESLFRLVKPESLLSWHRVRLANMLGHGGKGWSDVFAKFASGTYPNQYMIVDLSLFVRGEPLAAGLLYVVEEIPGLIEAQDMTETLAKGYWPSYNIAFFDNIYEISGTKAFADKYGLDYTYELAARAQLFRRDAPRVDSYKGFWEMLRSNDYKNDPLSRGDPLRAICGRGDLGTTAQPRGCIDTKTTHFSLALDSLQADIINGPTYASNLPPFEWSERGGALAYQLHLGVAERFDFNATCVGFMKEGQGCSF